MQWQILILTRHLLILDVETGFFPLFVRADVFRRTSMHFILFQI